MAKNTGSTEFNGAGKELMLFQLILFCFGVKHYYMIVLLIKK